MRNPALPLALAWLASARPAWAAVPQDLGGRLAVGAALAAGAALFVFGFLALKRKRLIENLPTSKTRSMALGLVELKGRSVAWNCLNAPFSGTPCVYYRYRLEEYRSQGKSSKWVTMRSGDSRHCPFYLEDDTGRVLVHPDGADGILNESYSAQAGMFREVPPGADTFLAALGFSCRTFLGIEKKLRFTEWRIDPGQDVYVLGTCRTNDRVLSQAYHRALEASVAKGEEGRDLGGGLFVGGKDLPLVYPVGRSPEPPLGDDRVFVGPSRGMPFLLSDKSERDLTRGMAIRSFFGILGGGAILAGVMWFLAR